MLQLIDYCCRPSSRTSIKLARGKLMTYSSPAFGVVEPTPKKALPKILRISQLGTEVQIPSPAVAAQNAYIQTTENLGL